MDHARPHETQQSKSSMLRHREHIEESGGDKRPSEGFVKSATEDEIRPFRRVGSPPRAWVSSSFKPRFRGRYFRPRFLKDDRSFWKPGFGFQRYHHFTPRPRCHYWEHTDPRMTLAQREREKKRLREEREKAKERGEHRENVDTSCPPKDCTSTLGPLFARSSSSREKDKLPFSFNASQEKERSQSREGERDGAHSRGKDREGAHSRERDRGRERELPSIVSQAAARNTAIQQKRGEIEKIYHQDCDMFGAVVRMLIAKDPSLERPIQSALQENLREIGMRCVEAMQQFIEEYDSREVSL